MRVGPWPIDGVDGSKFYTTRDLLVIAWYTAAFLLNITALLTLTHIIYIVLEVIAGQGSGNVPNREWRLR